MKKKDLKGQIQALEDAIEELQAERLDIYNEFIERLKNPDICIEERKRILIDVLKLDLAYNSSNEQIIQTIKNFIK